MLVQAVGFDTDRLPLLIPNEIGNLATPAIVGFEPAPGCARLVGEAASTAAQRRPGDFCVDTKRPLLARAEAVTLAGHTLAPPQLAAMLLA